MNHEPPPLSLAPFARSVRSWRVYSIPPRNRDEPSGRRLLNVLVAALAILAVLPVMLVIAVITALTSRGSVLFRQVRIGLDQREPSRAGGNTRRQIDLGGRPFVMYKFRTMRIDDGLPDRAMWASPDDPRVTAFGRLLRCYRLDELPQLFNVLKGDMNIVGPRPEQPEIFVQLREQVEGYQRRQRVRPGITGWAQVNQGYDRTIEDVQRKVAFDLDYIRRQSGREDLRIMLRTVPVMFFGRGAY